MSAERSLHSMAALSEEDELLLVNMLKLLTAGPTLEERLAVPLGTSLEDDDAEKPRSREANA